jgi:small subunit ribosomal protein S6
MRLFGFRQRKFIAGLRFEPWWDIGPAAGARPMPGARFPFCLSAGQAALENSDDSRRGAASGGVSDRPKERISNMPLYEHVFLARQDLAQAQVDALAENATKIVTDNGGKVVKTETWGLRSLAYRIAKNRKAHYVALDIDAPAPAIAELERQSNINEDVIRFLTIKVDEQEKGPSAMMRRGDKERSRSDRGDRVEFRAREEEVE